MQTSVTGKLPRHCHGLNRSKGFTLLEVMVVMVLIGVLSSSLLLTFSNDTSDTLLQTRERLQRFSLQLYEQAVLRNQLLALTITPQGEVQAQYYQHAAREAAALFAENGRWQTITDTALTSWQLPADVSWSLSSSAQRAAPNQAVDNLKVLFNPQGLVSPFQLTLRQQGQTDQQFDDHYFYPQASQSTKH